jgi:hypothetical protein
MGAPRAEEREVPACAASHMWRRARTAEGYAGYFRMIRAIQQESRTLLDATLRVV